MNGCSVAAFFYTVQTSFVVAHRTAALVTTVSCGPERTSASCRRRELKVISLTLRTDKDGLRLLGRSHADLALPR